MARYSGCMSYSAEKYCAHCGGYIFVPDVTVWKYKLPTSSGGWHWFCIWSCMEAYRKAHIKPPKDPTKRPSRYAEAKYPNSLRRIRKHFGISQREISDVLGYATTAQVSRVEKGYIPIPQRVIPQMCEMFGCTADDLMRADIPDDEILRWETKKERACEV